MSIKLSNPTLIYFQKFPSNHAEELKEWYDIQCQIFQKMDDLQLEVEINRAI
nr:hypothetical protein [Moraxella osloensis]